MSERFSGRISFLSCRHAANSVKPLKATHQTAQTDTSYFQLPPPQPFYGPFSGTTRVSQCQKRTSGLYGARED